MQTNNRLFDDLAKVANSAVSTLAGVRSEVEAMVRWQMEKFMADANMVPRDEFEAMKAVAQTARTEQEKLEERVAALEAKVAERSAAPTAKTARKPRASRAKTAKS